MPGWDDLSPAPPSVKRDTPRVPGYAEAFTRGVRDAAPPPSDAWNKLATAPPKMKEPTAPSLWDRLKRDAAGGEADRGLNMGVGNLVDAAGATVGFLANPVNAVLNYTGIPQSIAGEPLRTDVGMGWSEAAGFEQPRDRTERIVKDVSVGAGAGLLTAGAAGSAVAATRGTTGLLPSFLQFMAEAPVVNTVAGGTGGGSAGAAREAGYGPVGQTVAGLAGGLAGGIGAARLSRPRAPGMPPEPLVDGSLDVDILPPLLPGAPSPRLLERPSDIIDGQWTEVNEPLLPAPAAPVPQAPLALPAPPRGLADLRGDPAPPANSNRPLPLGQPNAARTPDVIAGPDQRFDPAVVARIAEELGLAPPGPATPRGQLLTSTSDRRGPEDVWARLSTRREAANDLDLPAIPDRPLSYDLPTVVPPAAGIGSRSRMVSITQSTESGNRRYGSNGKLLTSPKGAKGEMQVLDGTNSDPGYGVTPARDNSPDERARVGRDYLAALTRHYDGDPAKAWAAYNAGPGRLDQALRRGGDNWLSRMPAETQAYVVKNMKALGGDGPISSPVGSTPKTADFSAPEGDFLPVQARASITPEDRATGPDPLALPPPVKPALTRSLTADSAPPASSAQFRPDDIEADAALMQFKAGGDEQGVTDRLRGVTKWEPMFADPLMVWEAADGRRLVADGHQRLGLAKRLEAEGHPPITLDAKVLREVDGVSAQEVRATAALRNIGQGTGTSIDAAKVIRDMGDPAFRAWSDRLPQKGPLVRDARDLARLSPEAFGAVVNEVIPSEYGAIIGRQLPDSPAAHKAMADLLYELDPPNARQADTIVRQAIADGFSEREQVDMFGSTPVSTSLYKQKAAIVDEAKKRLGRLSRVYGTAATEADTLASVRGNRIEVDGSKREASANGQLAEAIDRLATRKGNAVSDALDGAARALAGGAKRADAVEQFLAPLRGRDAQDLARGMDESSGAVPRDVDGGGQLDAFGTRPGDERRALERSGEGRQAGDVAQKPPGSEGGLFDDNSGRQADMLGDAPSTPREFALPDDDTAKRLDAAWKDQTDTRAVDDMVAQGLLEREPGASRARLTEKGRKVLYPKNDRPTGDEGFVSVDILTAPFRALGKAADWTAVRNDGAALLAKVTQVFGSPKAALKASVARIGQFGEGTLYSADAALRSMADRLNAPSIVKVADMFHARAGAPDGTARTYHEATDRAANTRTQQLYDALEPHLKNKPAMGRIRDLLATPAANQRATAAERAAATKVRDLLKDTLEYRRDAGESIGEVGDGYFPRIIDAMQVATNPAKFIKAAERVYRAAGASDPHAAATAWAQRIGDTYAGIDGGLENIRPGSTPNSAKAREFGKLADTMLRDFYNTDPFDTLASYIGGSARKAEQVRRFGPKGREGSPERAAWVKQHGDRSQWAVLMDQIKDELRASSGDIDGAPADVLRIRDANLGKLYRSAGNGVSLLHAWNTVSVMDRATISSLGDLAMGFVRGGPRYGVQHLGTSLHEFGRRIAGKTDSDATRYAEALGVANDAYGSALLQARADGGTKLAVGSKTVDGFYRAIGLQQLTEAGRVAATKTGQHFMADLAGDMVSASARTRTRGAAYLRELGIKDPDAFAARLRQGAPTRDDLMSDQGFAADYATALMRYVDQSIMMPTKAQRPTWTTHPVGSLFFSLQSYSYGFKKNVIDRVVRETGAAGRERDPQRLAAASGLVVLAGLTYINDTYLRPALFGSRTNFDDETSIDTALRVADRAGFLGPASQVVNMFKGFKYQREPTSALAGPIIGRLGDGVYRTGKAAFFNSEKTNTDERNAAGAVYDLAVEPALDLGALRYLRGPARTAAIEATGNRNDNGVLPADREAFVSEMAGEKKP